MAATPPPQTWLRNPLTWIAVAGAALMGGVMVSSYIGGLVDPTGHLQDAPIGLVNADAGVKVGATTLDAGDLIQQKLTATQTDRFDWQVLSSQAEAERKIRDNDLWGAIVVPRDFSPTLAKLVASPAGAAPAHLLLLTNEGSGIFQPDVFRQLSAAATGQVSTTARQQVVTLLDKAGTKLSPSDAAAVGEPVVAETRAVIKLPDKAGRGIAPFYLSVMITLTGFLAASIVGIGIDLLRGSSQLELLGRFRDLRPGGVDTEVSPMTLWVVKAVPTVLAAALGGLCAVGTALVVFGMDVSSAWKAYALGALGSVTIALISLVFLTLFGIAGELLGVLFTTIFGVPAALGIYPYQAVPGAFRFIASWHPLRYLSDAMRSIAFYNATGAGLARGVLVTAFWLMGALIVGATSAYLLTRRARTPS